MAVVSKSKHATSPGTNSALYKRNQENCTWSFWAFNVRQFHTNTKIYCIFVGRASKASCFGTSAEKVPLHISSGKQAEQMLRAESQSTALTPHLTEPPAHHILITSDFSEWRCYGLDRNQIRGLAFTVTWSQNGFPFLSLVSILVTHLDRANVRRMRELPFHLMHAHLQRGLTLVRPFIVSAVKQNSHRARLYFVFFYMQLVNYNITNIVTLSLFKTCKTTRLKKVFKRTQSGLWCKFMS